MTKTYEQINDRIESGKAVVLTADEIMDYVDTKGLEAAKQSLYLALIEKGWTHHEISGSRTERHGLVTPDFNRLKQKSSQQ